MARVAVVVSPRIVHRWNDDEAPRLAAELELARAALAAVPGAEQVLHARVDLVSGDGGEPMIMELELTDPYLFLRLFPGSEHAVAEAIAARLQP